MSTARKVCGDIRAISSETSFQLKQKGEIGPHSQKLRGAMTAKRQLDTTTYDGAYLPSSCEQKGINYLKFRVGAVAVGIRHPP